ncbi:fatty acid desaturase family protein [Arsenicicoccus piscis]|uniref:fatty acid desaturase family protein n=1 Tax=Arsenicicoccus piscis TaxID=673954 RepID=UPI003D67BBB8
MIRAQRLLELGGRATLVLAGKRKAAWVAGVGMLSVAKILENMELGHNIIHGQWDWMRDPDIHSTTWEWDFVAPAAGWKHTHNDLHHTYTNVLGKDSDVGYDLLRVNPDQPWEPQHYFNVPLNMILAPFFEWGIAFYDLEIPKFRTGEVTREEFQEGLKALGRKMVKQAAKDYTATPLLAQAVSGSGKAAFWGTFAANTVRNLWAHSVIFCGHFPDGVDVFTEEMIDGETRGDWYVRQMLGSANISGSALMHLMTGNLSHQIEHHLFPDLPSNHYAEIAVKVRDICARYGLPYVTGPLHKQISQSWRTIAQLSVPGSGTQREGAQVLPLVALA